MGRSASRVGDEVLCDEHPSAMGRVTAGSGNVNEAQRPVSRFGDPALCRGERLLSITPHASFATEGSATVLINGRPAVRHGDRVAPGGSTLFGADMVFIGGPLVGLPSNLSVEGSDSFKQEVFAQLGLIAGTRSGQRLFADLQGASPRTVRIVEHDPERYPGKATFVDDDTGDARPVMRGKGGDGRVEYYPRMASEGQLDHAEFQPGTAGDDAVLFHELMHARGHLHAHRYPKSELTPEEYRELTGQDGSLFRGKDHGYESHCQDEVTGNWHDCGEPRAAGLYPYEDSDLSENPYRRERGYVPRTFY